MCDIFTPWKLFFKHLLAKYNLNTTWPCEKLLFPKIDERRARAASESNSKRGSFEWITNCQEFWSIEMGHLTYEMGIKLRRCLEEESSFRHQTFDFWAFSFRESYWKSFGKSCKYLSFCLRAEWEWNNQLLKVVDGGWWVHWDFNVSSAPFPFELRLRELN